MRLNERLNERSFGQFVDHTDSTSKVWSTFDIALRRAWGEADAFRTVL